MPEEKKHLHKNYRETYCGEDASHLQTTFNVADTTCGKCLDELEKARKRREKLDADATDLNTRVAANQDAYTEATQRLAEKHQAAIEALGKEATDLTESRTVFQNEFTHIPERAA